MVDDGLALTKERLESGTRYMGQATPAGEGRYILNDYKVLDGKQGIPEQSPL